MKSPAERRAEYEQFKTIDAAFRAGDLAARRTAVDDPGSVPDGPMPLAIGPCLEYAIYHSPLPFIRTLLEMGADPNPGRPCRISAADRGVIVQPAPARRSWKAGRHRHRQAAALVRSRSQSASERNLPAVEILLDAGADPRLRTRIDDCETPREMAEQVGLRETAELLATHEARRGKS